MYFRFGTILTAINVDIFGNYAHETVQCYLNHYSWYLLTPTVHKVLMHGADFIIHFLLPLGLCVFSRIIHINSLNKKRSKWNITYSEMICWEEYNLRKELFQITGSLSEEEQESRNKDFRTFRIRFARKASREGNLKDIFSRFLISSDPLITYFSKQHLTQKTVPLPEDVTMMIEHLKKNPFFLEPESCEHCRR